MANSGRKQNGRYRSDDVGKRPSALIRMPLTFCPSVPSSSSRNRQRRALRPAQVGLGWVIDARKGAATCSSTVPAHPLLNQLQFSAITGVNQSVVILSDDAFPLRGRKLAFAQKVCKLGKYALEGGGQLSSMTRPLPQCRDFTLDTVVRPRHRWNAHEKALMPVER